MTYFQTKKKKYIALAILASLSFARMSFVYAAPEPPVIAVATPDSQGLSHNRMQELNVGQEGIVFNNNAGPAAVQSALAGQIARNANLTNGAAKTILAEVTGTGVSNLQGMIEVAGSKANFILANPNGITGNGFGFINVDRATLTTGRPSFDTEGNLKGFTVKKGKIAIVGQGNEPVFNEDGSYKYAPVSKLDIYAQTAEINAELWAQDAIHVVAGQNEIDYASGNATALDNDKSNGVNLDVGALGGMYAGAITLVGTNEGLGMKIGGNLRAQKDLKITNNGQIVFERNEVEVDGMPEANDISAVGNITIDANSYNITNEADIVASGTANIKTTGKLLNSGKVIAGESYENPENEEEIIQNSAQLVIRADGGLDNKGLLDASDKVLVNGLEWTSTKNPSDSVVPEVDNEDRRDAEKLTGPDVAKVAGIADSVQQDKISDEKLTLTADVQANGKYRPIIDKAANGVDLVQIAAVNANGVSRNVYSDFNIKSSGLILNNATKYAKTELAGYIDKNMYLAGKGARVILNEVSSANPSTLNGYLEVAGNKASVVIANANGISVNGLGFINTDTVTLSTGKVTNWEDGNIRFGSGLGAFAIAGDGLNALQQTNLYITAADFINDRSELYANQLQLDVNGKLQNTGKMASTQDMKIAAKELSNAENGYIEAKNNLDVQVQDNIEQNAATMKAGGNLVLTGQGVLNQNTSLVSAGDSLHVIAADGITNDAATLLSGGTMQLDSKTLTNNNTALMQGTDLKLQAKQSFVNDHATIYFSQTGDVKADQVENSHEGSIYFGGDANIATNSLINNKANINIMGNLVADTGAAVNTDSAYLGVGKNATIMGTSFTNSNLASVFVDDNLVLRENGNVLNEDALIATGGFIDIKAKNVSNVNDSHYAHGSVINAGGNITLDADEDVLNRSSDIESAKDIAISAKNITNKKDRFTTDWVVTTEDIAYAIEPLKAPNYYKADRKFTRTIHTGYIKDESDDANIIASGNIILTATNEVVNHYSKVMAGKNLTVTAGNKVENIGYQGTIHHDDLGQDNHHWKYKKHRRMHIRCRWKYGTTVIPYEDHNVYDETGTDSERLAVLSANGTFTIQAAETVNQTLEADGAVYENRSKTVDTNVTDKLQGNEASDTLALDSSKLLAVDALRINSKIYTLNDDPSAKYLVETNQKFAGYREFLSSDYLLARVAADPEKVSKRIGDGYFEQQLVLQQILQLTGRKYLGSYGSDMEQYAALMNAGAVAAKEMNLTVGIALTAEQIVNLTSDIVWLVEEDINGQKVLVPEVYLARLKDEDLRPSGALIVGSDVDIVANRTLENMGTIQADGTVYLRANDITNRFGDIAAENVKLQADEKVANIGGRIIAEQDIDITAKNITNEAVRENGDYKELKQERIIATGEIEAGRDATLRAEENIINRGSVISAGETLLLDAGKNIDIDTTTNEKHVAVVNSGAAEIHSIENQQAVLVGKNIELNAGADVTSTGGVFSAGENLQIDAGGDVALNAAKDLYSEETTIGSRGGSYYNHNRQVDETVVGTELASGQDIGITAQNITMKGSNVNSEAGAVKLNAANDITIANETEYHEQLHEFHSKVSGVVSSKTTDVYDYSNVNAVVGSNVSGNEVHITSGNDTKMQGSNVIADKDVTVQTGGNLDITSAAQTSESEYIKQVKKSGLIAGPGLGFTIGKEKKRDEYDNQNVEQVGSIIGSVDGSVSLAANKDVTIHGSEVLAGKDIVITGANVDIENSDSVYNHVEKHEYERSGLSVSVGGTVAGAAQTVYNSLERAHQVSDNRLAVLYGVKAYKDVEKGISDIETVYDKSQGNNLKQNETAKDYKNNLINIRVGIGSEKSKSESNSTTIVATGSNVQAAGDVSITSTKKDITIKGSTVQGENVVLNAAQNLNITASKDSNVTKENSKSRSASVGGSIGLSGFAGVDASYSQSKSDIKANSTQYNESMIEANNELTFNSKADTNIKGGVLSGNKVVGNVGRNLNIESLKDENNYEEKTTSLGGSVSSSGGWSASANRGNIDSEYSSVTTQSGINAGNEGFDIYVGSNTDLKGGIIGSSADADKNKLSTGTLTFSDIDNKAEYSASNIGVNANIKNTTKNNEKGITPNIGMPASDDAESTTKATVAPGTIEIRDKGNQKQDVADLNRNLNDSLNKLGEIFDKDDIKERQELAGLFGELAYNEIHYMNASDEQKVVYHAVVGGIMSQLTNGEFLSGASAAAVNKMVMNQIKNKADKDPAMLQWLSATIGAVVGEVVAQSSESGASVAANATKNNDLDQELSTEFGHIPKTEKEVMDGEEQNLDNKYEINLYELFDVTSSGVYTSLADETLNSLLSREFPDYQRIESYPGSNSAFRVYYKSGGQIVSTVLKGLPLVSGGYLLVKLAKDYEQNDNVDWKNEVGKFTISQTSAGLASGLSAGVSGIAIGVVVGKTVEISYDTIQKRIMDIQANGVRIE